ncbi:MAG TPA: hypothetical protein VH684_05420 [Xanthobacteraceae bacterium]|jgi:predicted metal-dependent hydrolase
MSPRKAAAATDHRNQKLAGAAKAAAAGKKTTAKAAVKTTSSAGANGASAEAKHLAATIERDLREGRLDTLSKEAFQALMAALCKSYGTQLEAGADFLPVADRASVSPTEIMSTTSGLLKAANLAVFELGMWQSWTGR